MICLRNKNNREEILEATFLPEMGMNMVSFKVGGLEIIDQSTRELFEERFAGLGALIGLHFHRRRAASLPSIRDESLFPHIARVKAKGVQDPFSHGIARYAPWKAEATKTKVIGSLSGKDLWNGISLAELEGQEFTMAFSAELIPKGLQIQLSVVSSTDSLVGIHYYYHLPEGKSRIVSQVKNHFLENGQSRPLVPQWLSPSGQLSLELGPSLDYTFYPAPEYSKGLIILETSAYTLRTFYEAPSQENCWQLYHPEGSSFVCIEPLSSQDPHHPNLTVSSLSILLSPNVK